MTSEKVGSDIRQRILGIAHRLTLREAAAAQAAATRRLRQQFVCLTHQWCTHVGVQTHWTVLYVISYLSHRSMIHCHIPFQRSPGESSSTSSWGIVSLPYCWSLLRLGSLLARQDPDMRWLPTSVHRPSSVTWSYLEN